jgi:flagellar basal-body rod modification protein FlgD
MADAIAGSGSSTAATSSGSGSASKPMIAQNFDSFLLLLTTQLKNQSPLDPLDTNQFTQQLVQFASVEQQLKSNDTLSALLTSAKSSTASNAANFVGLQITADGATSRLSEGKAEWTLNPARNAAQATITIRDKAGSVVATQTKGLAAGAQSFSWDGRTSTGTLAPDGDYTIAVTARDAAGQAVTVKSEIAGRVSSVDLSGDGPVLLVGNLRVPLAQVKAISPAAN